jgi:hypothetical protein
MKSFTGLSTGLSSGAPSSTIFLNGQHMSFEHQKVIAASTAALMSISSFVREIQLQPAILKQYAVWIAAPAAALEHHHPKCKKKTSTQWLTVEDCSRIGLSRGHGWQQPSKACSSRAHWLAMEEGGACKKIETVWNNNNTSVSLLMSSSPELYWDKKKHTRVCYKSPSTQSLTQPFSLLAFMLGVFCFLSWD